VISNFGGDEVTVNLCEDYVKFEVLIANYDTISLQREIVLRPYDSIV
jgi:hypothetical protein